MILLGLRYIAASIPLFSFVGVGVGVIFGLLLIGISRNPSISNALIRWAFIGFSLVEVSGFIGLVFCFLFLYALPLLDITAYDQYLSCLYSVC